MKNQLVGSHDLLSTLRAGAIASGWVALCCIAACRTSVNVLFLSDGVQGNGPPSPGYAYVASTKAQDPTAAGVIYQYAIALDGSLSPLAVTSVPTGANPLSIAADSTGHFVYTANAGDGTLSQFEIGSGGTLTPLIPSSITLPSVPPGSGNYSLSVDPTGHYVYVVVSAPSGPQSQAFIDQFSIGPDGTLTPLVPAFVTVPAFASGALAIEATGSYAYLGGTVAGSGQTGATGAVFQFSIGADGTLVPLPGASVSTAGSVVGIAFAPSGNTAFVLSACIDDLCDGNVAPYLMFNSGALSPAGAATLTGSHVNPVDLILDGSGSSAYLLANWMGVDTDSGSVYQFTLGGADVLAPGTPPSFPLTGSAVAMSKYGPDLYVLSGPAGHVASTTNSVAIYSIGSDGVLTSLSSIQIPAALPRGIALVAAH